MINDLTPGDLILILHKWYERDFGEFDGLPFIFINAERNPRFGLLQLYFFTIFYNGELMFTNVNLETHTIECISKYEHTQA